VVPQGPEVLGVADGQQAGRDGLPAEFVQVEGDGVGGVQSGERGPVAVAEEQRPAVGGVDVEAGAVGGAAGGDLGQRVDQAGVGGAGGGGDQVGARHVGQGVVEGGGVEGAGGSGDLDGVGQAEEPGGTGQRVVGAGRVDEPHGGAEPFAREEEGELVGLGTAGGDEAVGVAGLAGEGCG